MAEGKKRGASAFDYVMLVFGFIGNGLALGYGVLGFGVWLATLTAYWWLLMMGLAGLLLGQVIAARKAGTKRSPPTKRSLLLLPLVGLLVAATAVGVTAIAFLGGALLIAWVREPATNTLIALCVCLPLSLLLGGLLFIFRLRRRMVYGFTEIAAGLVVTWYQVSSVSDAAALGTGFLIAITTASLFLIVRGMDNVHQGYTGTPPDPLAARVQALLLKLKKEQAP